MKHWDREAKILACIVIVVLIALGYFIYWGVTTGRLKSNTHSDELSSQCKDMGDSLAVCKIPQPNGETVTCVRAYGMKGGISCDWKD